MFNRISVLLAAIAAAGCGSNPFGPGDEARIVAQAPTDAELAAYAGSHKYPATQPTTQPAKELKAAAIVDRNRGVVKVYNFSDQPIQNADVWINHAYVEHLRGLAPASAPVLIRFSDLYNSFGQRFSSQNEQVRTVQVEQNGELYSLLGPAAE